jgi:hypothetical protein
MRLITALAISSALFIGSIAAVDVAAAGTGHDAVAAKKKKKKKKKSAIFLALSGHSLNRVIPNSAPTPAGTERWDFCRNGSYLYRKVDYNGDNLYQTTYNGLWKVINSAGTAGVVQYSVGNFQSIFGDGQPAETTPAGLIAVPVSLGPFGIFFSGSQYTTGAGAC